MTCEVTFTACKRASESKPFGFRWTDRVARLWQPDYPYAAGVRVRPSTANARTGFEYESSGGQSKGTKGPSAKDPKWPAALGGTVVDGSITWTAVPLSYSGLLERIVSVSWPAVAGLTIVPRAVTDEPGLQETLADFSGGIAGTTYTVTCSVTTSANNVYTAVLELQVE